MQVFPPTAASQGPTADKRTQPPGFEERSDAANGAGARTDPGSRTDARFGCGESRFLTYFSFYFSYSDVEWFLRSVPTFNCVFSFDLCRLVMPPSWVSLLRWLLQVPSPLFIQQVPQSPPDYFPYYLITPRKWQSCLRVIKN
jgi:hypothetical protein